LAAIAIPQFAAYRTRSYNANAKATNKLAVNAGADVNAEIGVYGTTEAVGGKLVAAPMADEVGVVQASSTTAGLKIGATVGVVGGRLSGTNAQTLKGIAVPMGIGAQMGMLVDASPESAAGGACVSGGCSNIVITRADKGDTTYASDSDAPSVLFSVINANWPTGAVGINAVAAALVATDAVDNFNNVPGGGVPNANFTQLN
jgi:hypothetical protein